MSRNNLSGADATSAALGNMCAAEVSGKMTRNMFF